MTQEHLSLYDLNYAQFLSGDEWDIFPQVNDDDDLESLVAECVRYLDTQEARGLLK